MLLLFVGVPLFVLLALVLLHRRQMRGLSSNAVLMPGSVPILGHAPMVLNEYPRFLHWVLKLTKEACGKPFQLKVLGQPTWVFLTDPVSVKYVLNDNFNNYEKGHQFIDRMHDFLGNGIFNVDGAAWYSQRKTAAHIFTRKELQGFMFETFVSHGQTMLEVFGRFAKQKQQFDFQEWMQRYTMEAICSIAFGVEFGNLDDSKATLDFTKSFEIVNDVVQTRFLATSWEFRKKFWFFFSEERKHRKAMQLINNIAYDIIAHRRQEKSDNNRQDLLSLFMKSKDENGEPYSDVFLRDMIVSFLLAGRDTTAAALCWLFHSLMLNPHIFLKLKSEIDAVLEGKTPTFDDVNTKLPYLHACVKETLRLYPSVPKDGKYCVKEDTLPDGTNIPHGALVWYLPWVMGRLDSLWDEPEKFQPERWISNSNDYHEPSMYQYIAFNAGPRLCLGQTMAYIEIQTIAAMIIQKFDITPSPGQDISYLTSIILRMKDPFYVQVQAR